jgi:hypothetical protein
MLEEWASVLLIHKALQGALCGAPFTKVATQQQLERTACIAAALMAVSCDMMHLIFQWWQAEMQQGMLEQTG